MSQQYGGIRQYTVALLNLLARDTENNYFVYHENDDPEVMAVLDKYPRFKLIRIISNKNKFNKNLLEARRKLLRRIGTRKKIEEIYLEWICKHYRINIIHCTYQYLPQTKNVRSICTMHDVQELHFPEYFAPQDRAERAADFWQYTKNADKIIVSYQHIKDDIIKYFRVPSVKIEVILLEMNNLWLDKFKPIDIIPLTGIDIQGPYILYPANTWQHKNHLALLTALLALKNRGITDIKVVCTGHQTPYFETTLKPFIEEHGLQGQVLFPGVVDEITLYSLYKTCVGVAIPTLYEAGSFPLMEAILLEVPVICSNVTSLPETIGNTEFIFDPGNIDQLSQKLLQLWQDEDFRQRSRINGKKQTGSLTHTGALAKMQAVYSSLKQ
jgi:glycosyltransferase involved in cell wall biosynthesis